MTGFLFPVSCFHSLHPGTDVLACPECGGRLRCLATIQNRAVVEKIVRHLNVPIDPPTPTPARVTGRLSGFETSADWVTE